jgi:hypothetical protein
MMSSGRRTPTTFNAQRSSAQQPEDNVTRQVLGFCIAFIVGARSVAGSPSPSRSSTQPTTVDIVDHHGLTQADFFLFATMFWLQPSDNGGLELTPGVPSFLDQHGALIKKEDARWVFRNRGGELALAFYKLKQDPDSSQRIEEVAKRVVEAIPDGSNAVFGHRTAFNIFLKEGVLQELVKKANEMSPHESAVIVVPNEVLDDPHVWGYAEDSMVLNGRDVWSGPRAALPFHCCAGRIRVSPVDEGGDPLLALVPKAHQALMDTDRDYATRYLSIIGPLDREAMSLPHTKQGGERCDQLTTEVRTKLRKAGLTDKVEAKAESLRQ